MKKILVSLFVFTTAMTALVMTIGAARAATGQVLVNTWACTIGDDDCTPGDIDEGWSHNEFISLSRCCKNPAPPSGLLQGGAAFKVGPPAHGGTANPGDTGVMTQTIVMSNTGVSPSDYYTVNFSSLIVCVGCDFLVADLYGLDEESEWEYVGRVMDYLPGQTSCGPGFWPRYCGDTLVVPHFDEYLFELSMQYTYGPLGVKATGLELLFEPVD